jgi:hypothetical protein
MENTWRVEGIYDLRTLKFLRELGINQYHFDFRVRSFNFLQQHLFLDIVRYLKDSKNELYFAYENEKDFVVQKFLDDLKSEFPELYNQGTLEFNDSQGIDYFSSFNYPFIWSYQPDLPMAPILSHPLCKGIHFSLGFLEMARESGQLRNFTQNFLSTFYQIGRPDQRLLLSHDWDADLRPLIFELFDFNTISLPINNKIEVCYRNVDMNKFSEQLNYVQKAHGKNL